MKSRKSVVLLVLLCVFASQAVFASLASASLKPYFQWYGVMANNTPDGMQTLVDVTVADPDGSVPGAIQSLTVSGPGLYHEFTAAEYSITDGDYWVNLPGLPADGEYIFTVTDTDNNTATTYSYLAVGGVIPLPDPATFQASGANPLAPTLSWSAIPGYPENLFYRAKILTDAGEAVWSSSRTFITTSATVPGGKLQEGQSYCWRVDAFDNFSLQNGNTRSTSECIPLSLKNTHPYFTSVGAFSVHNTDGTFATGLYMQGGNPKGSVTSLVVTDPSGGKHTYPSPTCLTPATSCNFSYAGTPAEGLYTFAVTNSDNNTAESYFHLDFYDVPLVDPATMHASGNALAPVLSWSAPAGIDRPLYYYVFVRDAVTQAAVWSNWTAQNTSITIPQGQLNSGKSYQWRVIPNDSANFTVSNRSFTPWTTLNVDNSSPFFLYAQLHGRNKTEGEVTGFDVSVRDRKGVFPGNLTSLTVSGPGGFSYTFGEGDYYPSDNSIYHEFPGAKAEGRYTFTLTDENGTSVSTYDYHKHGGGAIPLMDESSFQVSGSPLTPTISWSAVRGYPSDLYYRLRIVNQWGATVFAPSTPWWPATYQVVPAGTLVAGPSYQYRLDAFDARYAAAYDNRVNSSYHNFGVPSISGRVTNAEGTGLANISVQANNAATGASTPTVPTDANGDYLLSNLPSGNYRIFFSGVGYFSEWYNNKTSQPSADLVSVTAPDLTAGIDAVLVPSGGISGTVTNSLGAGIQNVWVHVHGPDGSGLFGTSTDQFGHYTLSSLATGNYKIRFNAPQGYLTECYNNKAGLDSADLIPVTVPDITSGIDAVLGPGGSITGTVRNAQATGVQGVQVQVYDLSGNWAASPTTNSNGVYTANGLAAGSYKVFFSPPSASGYTSEWYNNKPNQGSADPVAVTVPNITTGIDAVLEQGGTLAGTVRNGQGVGIANARVQVYDAADTGSTPKATVYAMANGSYTVIGLPTGSYKIFFSADCFFSEWYSNRTDRSLADPVPVTSGQTNPGIDAVLEASGCISGTVRNGAGVGIQNVWVAIFDASGYGLFGIPTNADGTYTASGLASGNYKVRFHAPQGYLTECYNNKAALETADLISVTVPDMTTGIDAVLGPGGSISGTVLKAQGGTFQNVQVQVYDLSGNWAAGATTNQNGVYTANGLAAGSYKVFFSPPSGSGYSSEWYNNKPGQVSADPVAVTVPNVTSNIDAVLEQGGSVSGTVRNGQNLGIANVQVQVYDAAAMDMSSPPKTTVFTNQSGSYAVTGLPTGNYKFFFSADCAFSQWYSNRDDQTSADSVAVAAPNVTSGIDVLLEASGCISGTVTDGEGVGIRNVNAQVFNTSGYWVSNAMTNSTGAYTVSNLATGSYRVCYWPPSGYRFECYNNKPTQDPVDYVTVTAPNMTTGIDAVLEPGGSISGKVRNAQGVGIANVQVQVNDLDGVWAAGVSTNQNGDYTANGLAAGNYKVFFSPPSASGYSSEWYNNKSNRISADLVPVTVPNITTGIDAVLARGGSISGKVRNGANAGIANAQVQVYDAADTNMNTPRATVTTDQNGNYTAPGLPTGSYKLFFWAVGYFSEWYNNKTDQASAIQVSVTAPNTKSGINVVLEKSGGITGAVRNGSGAGLPNVWVNVFAENGSMLYGTPTDQNGVYTANSLGNGKYKLCFNAPNGYRTEWYNDKATQEAANWVEVKNLAMKTGIDAVLAAGGSISGTVRNGQGEGIANVGVSVFHLDGTWASGTGTGPNGSYLASGLAAGSYRVQFSPPSDSPYSPEWYNNKAGQDSAHGVVVTVPNITAGIDAVLDAGGIITVLSANGGENWQRGSTRDITWAYAGNPGEQVKIQLLKGGKVSRLIVASVPLASGSYSWDIPADQAAGTNYQIKVTSTSNSASTDTSDDNFTISLPPPLTLLAPNGGEDWKVGSKHTIQWKYTANIGTTVKIQLLRGDLVVQTIKAEAASGTLGNGSYLWTVPKSLAYGSSYRVKVTSNSNKAYTDTSDAPFTISGPTLDVTAPDGGEKWPKESTQTITWTYTENPIGKVKIQLLKAGDVVLTIPEEPPVGSGGQGSFAWTLPQGLTVASNYKIKITHTAIKGCTGTSSGSFSITKAAPVAPSAGPDRQVTEAEPVTLSGANSVGFDKNTATFSWSQLDGPPVTLSNPAAVEPRFTAPEPETGDGSLTFQLTVKGVDGVEARDQCIVNVSSGNMPPVAEAGPTQMVVGGQEVVLDGSASHDPEGASVRYSWKQLAGPRVTLSDPASAQPAFTAQQGGSEGRAFLFELTVTDPDGLRSRDTCIVTVVGTNLPPRADAGAAQSALPGTLVTLDGSQSVDPEDGVLSFRWQQLAGPPVTLSDPAGVQPSFVAPTTRGNDEPLVFQLTVTDGANLMDKSRVSVVIEATVSGGRGGEAE